MKSKLFILPVLAFVNLIVFTCAARADEPLPPPADYSINSANGKYTATFQVKENRTTVYAVDKSSRKKVKTKLWEMEGWFRNTYLSNDGANLIVFYDGANLLETDYKPDEVMISFYDKGNLLNEIRLNQLVKDPSPAALVKTVSHYRWVDTYGMNEKQIFEVNTIEKKRFEFDIKTGQPIGTPLYIASTDSKTDSANESANRNAPSNQTNAADPNQPETKKEVKGCQAAILGIAACAVLSSFLTNQRQV